jgi:outer membrane protein OmpA-like peptidoglycan-associated protein
MKYVNLLLCGFSLLLSAGTARAEDPTLEEMVCALDPQCAMPSANRLVRGVTATPTVRPPGSFDITLNFPFDSAELTSESRTKLDKVAKALTGPSTSKFDIIISGHTDAKGSADYNQQLSDRRAKAVRQFLITEHGIDPKRLIAKGYGKTQLLLPSDPSNERNRRVQFKNSNYASASTPTATPSAPAAKHDTPAARPAAPAKPSAAEGTGL